MIFSSKNIPQLANYSFKEKHQILQIAGEKITTPQKLILNLIKLCVLVPPFIMFARYEGVMLILPGALLVGAYFLIMRPSTLYFQHKHIDKALLQFNQQKEDGLSEQD